MRERRWMIIMRCSRERFKFVPRDDTLPKENEYVVDEGKNSVVVKLKGRFESLATGKGWVEEWSLST